MTKILQFNTILSFVLLSLTFPQEDGSVIEMKKQAEFYQSIGQTIEAISIYEQILYLQESVLGKSHLDVAETLNGIGILHLNENNVELAEMYLNRSISIYNKYIDESKKRLIQPYKNLQELYSLSGNTQQLQKITNNLSEITTKEQQNGNDTINYSEAYLPYDHALELMDIGFSYIESNLLTEAINNFSTGLLMDSPSLDIDYFRDRFYLNEELYFDKLKNAFILQQSFDSDDIATDFYLSLIQWNSDSLEIAMDYMQKYSENNPADFRGFFFLAEMCIESRDYFNALLNFQQSYLLNPDYLESMFGIGKSLVFLGNLDDALTAFQQVLDDDSYHYNALYEIGKTYNMLEEHHQSISFLTQALLLNPDNEQTFHQLGIAYFNTTKIPQALEAFNRSVSISPENSEAYYYLGNIYENILNIEKAIESYSKASENLSNNKEINYRLGMLLYKTEQYFLAMKPLREFIILEPDSVSVLKVLGEVFIKENRFPEAIDTYERLIALDVVDEYYYSQIAESYWNLGEMENAKLAYENVLLFDDENTQVHYRLGLISNELGNFDNAQEHLLHAISCGTPTLNMYYQLALAFGNSGKYMQTLIAFQDALTLASDDSKIQYQMGVAFKELGLFNQAVIKFEEYAEKNEDDPVVFFLLGQSYLKLDQIIIALENFNKSLELNTNDHRILYFIGKCHYNLNDFKNAAKSLKKALKIYSDDPEAHYLLGLTYLKLNKKRSATKELNILYMLNQELYDSLQYYLELN